MNFGYFWRHLPEKINPVLWDFGNFEIRYYGLMYIAAFLTVYFLLIYRIRKENLAYRPDDVQSFLFWGACGVIVGGRIGYVLFYDWAGFAADPLRIIWPFSRDGNFTGISGMSYHGGALGFFIASFLFCRKRKISLVSFADFVVPVIPLGYTFGRIGNFLNGELYGRVTEIPWGMYFPLDPSRQLRHPSQLYEAFGEGIFLFLILWAFRKNKFLEGKFLSLYLIGYGSIRFLIEFTREPDSQLGLLALHLSMGQWLCLGMILTGMTILWVCRSTSRFCGRRT